MVLKNIFETPNDRLIGITDGVYAIAMTILALAIAVPAITEITSNGMMNDYFISSLIPQIVIYLISFFVVSIYWENSILLFGFEEVDAVIQFINFLALALVCLIPFNTGFLFNFMSYTQPGVLFSINNLVIALLYLIMCVYVIRKRTINLFNDSDILSFKEAKDKINEYFDKNIRKNYSDEELTIKYPHFKEQFGAALSTLFYMIVSPVLISLIALICSFFNTYLSIFVYLIMFIVHNYIKTKRKQQFNFNEINNLTGDELEIINQYKEYKSIN